LNPFGPNSTPSAIDDSSAALVDLNTTRTSQRKFRSQATRRHLIAALALALGLAAPASAQAANAAPSQTQGTTPVPITRRASAPATEVEPLKRLVTLDLRNARLEEVLEEIDRQAHVGFQYTPRAVPVDKRVTIKVTAGTVGATLKQLLKGTGVEVVTSQAGDVMLVRSTKRADAKADSITYGWVLGRVADSATAQPLAGAVVSIQGTPLQFVTTDSGVFHIQHVPTGLRTVIVRMLGYTPTEREVVIVDSQYVRVDFLLHMGMSRLQEVVTTATGKRRRLELGNDITVLNADSIVATQPVTSVTDLLEGRVPGLTVQRTSGAPGDPARLRLRGTSSVFTNNDPIVVVDGVRVYSAQSDQRSANLASSEYAAPSPLDYMDPHSIETIEVLKGPSAATLYGADAANGVIVITTKKGKAGPPRWTASIDHALTYMPGSFPDSYLRFGHVPWNSAPVFCPLTSQQCVQDSVVRFQPLNDPDLTVLGHGQRTATALGVSGGSDALQYNVNANYDDELGLVRLPSFEEQRYQLAQGASPPDWMERPERLTQWGATSRLSAKLGSRADLSITAMLTRTSQQRSSLESELATLMGTYIDRSTGAYYRSIGVGGMQATDAILSDYYQKVTDEATQFTNGVNFNWHPLSWLTTSADGGLNVIHRDDASLVPRGLPQSGGDTMGRAADGRGSSLVSTVNLRATASNALPWDFHLQTAVGVNYTDQHTSDLGISGSNLAAGSSSVGTAGQINTVSELDQNQATFGWYVEPSLNRKRLWLSTGIRFDGGNTFGAHEKLAGFPKVSASYLLSDEPFFPFKSVINTLRLRAAYGHAGVQPGPGDRLRLFSAPTTTWADGQLAEGAGLQALGNTHLKPERSTEFEGGFDADLLGDRLSLTATGYRKTRIDALMNFPLPPSVYGDNISILRNIGEIRNTGYELTLGTQIVRSDLVTWGAQLQLSHNKNVVVSLGQGVQPFWASGDARVAAGYPIDGRWGRPVVGYNDVNGDGILQPSEVLYDDSLVYLGSSEPDYTAGLSTTLSLFRGAVAVSADFTYSAGLAQVGPWDQLLAVSQGANDPSSSLAEQAEALAAARSFTEIGGYPNTPATSTLRFNSLSIAYNVPSTWAQRVGARSLVVALQGTNLGLHTNYRGKDPDVNGSPTGNDISDLGTLPQPRTWQLRVSASY
jgi:TonB-linked SusC/RagA family outer membrane protein